jgi:hypothetical protein
MRLGLTLILLLFFSVGAGPATRPATAPADPPASTPKEALRSLNLSQRDGNTAALRALFISSDEPGARLIDAMAEYAAALVALHDSAEKAYGPESANFITGDMKSESEKGLAAIDKSEVMIDHDTATVKYAGATDAPIRLVRVDGRWKLPVVQLLEGADKESEEKGVKELTLQSQIAHNMAVEIAAGKYKEGANKAREVWRARLLGPTTENSKTQAPSPGTENPKSQAPNHKQRMQKRKFKKRKKWNSDVQF